MTNRNVIPDDEREFLESAVQHCIILNIHFVAHFYKMHIAAYYCVIPNTAVSAHRYVANYGCGLREKCILANLWGLS